MSNHQLITPSPGFARVLRISQVATSQLTWAVHLRLPRRSTKGKRKTIGNTWEIGHSMESLRSTWQNNGESKMYLELYHMERLYNGIDDKTNQQCIWINHVIIDQTEEQAHFTPTLTIILVTSRSEVLLRTSRFLIFDEANWSPGNNPFCLFASHYNNKDAHSDT